MWHWQICIISSNIFSCSRILTAFNSFVFILLIEQLFIPIFVSYLGYLFKRDPKSGSTSSAVFDMLCICTFTCVSPQFLQFVFSCLKRLLALSLGRLINRIPKIRLFNCPSCDDMTHQRFCIALFLKLRRI